MFQRRWQFSFFFALLSGLVPALFTLIGAELDYHTTTLSSFQAGEAKQSDFYQVWFNTQVSQRPLVICIAIIHSRKASSWGKYDFIYLELSVTMIYNGKPPPSLRQVTSDAIKMTVNTIVKHYCIYCHFYCIIHYLK